MKSSYTFVALKFKQAVATALSLAVFLCLIGYFDTEKWCRNYHNCLNTISPCLGLSNGKYDTIFFVVQNTQIKQMQTNQNLQNEVVSNFNIWCGTTATETIKDLYRGWLQSDLADGVDAMERSTIYFNVERLIELVESITAKPTEPCKN